MLRSMHYLDPTISARSILHLLIATLIYASQRISVEATQSLVLPFCDAQVPHLSQHGLPFGMDNDDYHEAEESLLRYEAEFNVGFDRSIIGRQAVNGIPAIENNSPQISNILPGQTLQYIFSHTITSDASNSTQKRELQTPKEHAGNYTLPELNTRQDTNSSTRTVFVTINTCLQPVFEEENLNVNPPQLTLHVSTTNPNPPDAIIGPDTSISGPNVQSVVLDEGYATIIVNTTGDLYIGVSAEKVATTSAAWNYELGASIDQPYHFYNLSNPRLYMIDSDKAAALLVTRGLSGATPPTFNFTEWIAPGPPLSIFVQNLNDSSINGVRHSYCGLKQKSQIVGDNLAPISGGVQSTITTSQGEGPLPEQQFYVPNLNASSQYFGILAQTGNSTAQGGSVPGGGGGIFSVMNFTTKRLANCQVIFDLSFCTSVAYAVPANPATFPSPQSLAAFYDNSTQQNYQYFDWALQQTPCNTTDTAQYSLVRTCDDCAAAYKTWLCAVSIPRCEDWPTLPGTFPPPVPGGYISQPLNDSVRDDTGAGGYSLPLKVPPNAVYLMPRNAAQQPIEATPEIEAVTDPRLLDWIATNSSRNNASIAGQIMPGPYMEVLPCQELCFEIVRSCPASLSFGCPRLGKGLQVTYGRPGIAADGGVMCSEPGALWGFSGSTNTVPNVLRIFMFMASIFVLLEIMF